MARYSEDDLKGRLRLDFRVAMEMSGPLVEVSAFTTLADGLERKAALTREQDASRARFYRAEYMVRTLSGRGVYSDRTTVVFDLLGGGNYPYTRPFSSVISRPIPWSPHFCEGRPICTGPIWEQAKGKMLFGHHLVHVARLLNFDEVITGYADWNKEAKDYWRKELKGQPITPGLKYPIIPEWVYGERKGSQTQPVEGRQVGESIGFKPGRITAR